MSEPLADDADLRAASCTCGPDRRPAMANAHAAGCPAVERARVRQERDACRLLASSQSETIRRQAAEIERREAALAHIEAMGLHVAACWTNIVPGSGCDPACPTATAKRAREGK